MIIEKSSWKKVNQKEVSKFISDVKAEVIIKKGIEQLEEYIHKIIKGYDEDKCKIFLARNSLQNNNICGLLFAHIESDEKIILNPNELFGKEPFVIEDISSNQIAHLLLSEVQKWAKEEGINKLDFSFEIQGRSDNAESIVQVYEKLGFKLIVKGVGMSCDLTAIELSKKEIPLGYSMVHVNEIDIDELYQNYHETLSNSNSLYFLQQSEVEKRNKFDGIEEWGGFKDEASMVLMYSEEIAGFIIIIPINEQICFLDWMGIHPDHRRKGLGKFLLEYIMGWQINKGYKKLNLFCELGNTVALEMYKKLGFESLKMEFTYRWTS